MAIEEHDDDFIQQRNRKALHRKHRHSSRYQKVRRDKKRSHRRIEHAQKNTSSRKIKRADLYDFNGFNRSKSRTLQLLVQEKPTGRFKLPYVYINEGMNADGQDENSID